MATVAGRIQLEEAEQLPGDLALAVYLFDTAGRLLGEGALERGGEFKFEARLERPVPVEVIVGPANQADQVRQSAAYSQHFSEKDWRGEGDNLLLQPSLYLPKAIWWPWRPLRLCISGRVRKQRQPGDLCPVPYVKVEIFDVDREGCWWPYLYPRLPELLDRPVLRIPERIEWPPIVIKPPLPDPPPFLRLASERPGSLDHIALNPQPLPPREMLLAESALLTQAAFGRVGEAARLAPTIAARLDELTLSSRLAPWLIFPHCFYSRALICETYTDCDGFFRCCFNWWPFHFRRGRLRFDSRPDIIVRVTQIINGVETVIYLDPYTSTRWNVTNAFIDLTVDDEDVLCGHGCNPDLPPGSRVFMERVGSDPVYLINKHNGRYERPGISNVAYGDLKNAAGETLAGLDLYAQFGAALCDGAHYYRLSYARQTTPGVTPPDSAFRPIDHPQTPASLDHYRRPHGASPAVPAQLEHLGPVSLPGQTGPFYRIRDFQHYEYLYSDAEFIGTWRTKLAEADTGTYVLRLEVFNAAGSKLLAPAVEFIDNRGTGTGLPPATFPAMGNEYDLIITIDNQPVALTLAVPAAVNDCGVVPWASTPMLSFAVDVHQPNGRLNSWSLTCTKGTAATNVPLGPTSAGSSTSGAPGHVVASISGAPLLVGLTTTCAFALRLRATAHIRNGHDFFHYEAPIQAIAIERCGG